MIENMLENKSDKTGKKTGLEKINHVAVAYDTIKKDIGLKYSDEITEYYTSIKDKTKKLDLLENFHIAPKHALINTLKEFIGEEDARETVEWYGNTFGKDNGWIYIRNNHMKDKIK